MGEAKTRKLNAMEIAFIRKYVEDTTPTASSLFESQVAKGNATVTEKPGFVTMMIGNIDVEITSGGDYNGLNIQMWYCGTPITEI